MNRLWVRLSLSFVLLTWLVIGVVALLVRVSVQENFGSFLNVTNSLRFGSNFVQELEAYYAEHGTWQGVDIVFPSHTESGSGAGQNRQGQQGSQIYIASVERVIVYSTNAEWIQQTVDSIGPSRVVTLTHNGQIIGYAGEQTPGTVALNTAEQQFMADTTSFLWLAALSGGVIALVVGLIFARSLSHPLQAFTSQVAQMSSRDLGRPVTTNGTQEITQLAAAFNTLSDRLAMEGQRRQRMTADVAHELRTPVTIMRGHLEAMMDGIYPLDVPHIAVAYDQVLHLARLVEDLRLLTRAEAGQLTLYMVSTPPNMLLTQAIERFQPLADDAAVKIETHLADGLPAVQVDNDRMQQVLDNLLINALRHTPEGGSITLTSSPHAAASVEIRIHNTGTPIAAEDAEHLFDRFWRADDARERDQGGTGLGLAITRSLIQLHGGTIYAQPTPDGTLFVLTLSVCF